MSTFRTFASSVANDPHSAGCLFLAGCLLAPAVLFALLAEFVCWVQSLFSPPTKPWEPRYPLAIPIHPVSLLGVPCPGPTHVPPPWVLAEPYGGDWNGPKPGTVNHNTREAAGWEDSNLHLSTPPQPEAVAGRVRPLPVVEAMSPVSVQTPQETPTTTWAGEWCLAYAEAPDDQEETLDEAIAALEPLLGPWTPPAEADRAVCGDRGEPMSCTPQALAWMEGRNDRMDAEAMVSCADGPVEEASPPPLKMVGVDWTPAEDFQAVDRTHRAQTDPPTLVEFHFAQDVDKDTSRQFLSALQEVVKEEGKELQDTQTHQERDRTVEAMPPLPSPQDGLDALGTRQLRPLLKLAKGPRPEVLTKENMLAYLRAAGVKVPPPATTE